MFRMSPISANKLDDHSNKFTYQSVEVPTNILTDIVQFGKTENRKISIMRYVVKKKNYPQFFQSILTIS